MSELTSRRDRLARILMITLGVATLGAFANAAFEFGAVAPERINVEAWRMLAFPVFAGLFVLLGLFPRRMPGVWELVFFQKAGIAVFLAFFIEAAPVAGAPFSDNADTIITVDAVLAVVTFVSYLLTQGWRAWSPSR